MLTTAYGRSRTTQLTFGEAVARIKERLKDLGFGILCEIDVAKTLKEKIGVDTEPYVILGSCNPKFAHEALQQEPGLGLLLPCNVVVAQKAECVEVAAIDARTMLSVTGNSALAPIAGQVTTLLWQAIDGL